MLILRKGDRHDLEFLIQIDLKNDGYTSESDKVELTEQQQEEHRQKIQKYVIDSDKGAYIVEDSALSMPVGMIMYSITNRDYVYPWKTIYNEIDRNLFQSDGRFVQIFQLWVHPDYRRAGLATQLKRRLEEVAQYHNVSLIYTHTEAVNHHVIELNKKMGYQEVRRGPIWDDIIRVSLIKQINVSN